MQLEKDDLNFLKAQIEEGEALLILGAGASVTSLNARGEKIKTGLQLAALLASKAGLTYGGETLKDVLDAVRGEYLADERILSIYSEEFSRTKPSDDLVDLFRYTWKRVYTFNVDDTIENINSRSSQVRRYFNGISDAASEFESDRFLHVIHLHGEITKKEHGFIFTEEEYSRAIVSGRHHWYQRAGSDYISSCPIFIGTSLSEPIFKAEIERAKRNGTLSSGRGYVITPEELSQIQEKSLKGKGLVHVKATLEDFVA